ncbi:hypothetical protein [Eubacterium sp.]|uniref:hypothetical protein n=1 Tax=uncultured Eubacterium sp. TaxID=165185 RepID=UPI0025FD000D|nr:hypothetical protein [uncultured Eubacterium sp.]
MLDYISGQKGTGKTRMLTETAIYTAQQSKGNVVFAEYGSKISRILPVSVRHIDMKQYGITSAWQLYGFFAGICAGNYDITDIFVDATNCENFCENSDIDDFIEILKNLSNDIGVNIHLALSDEYSVEVSYTDVA